MCAFDKRRVVSLNVDLIFCSLNSEAEMFLNDKVVIKFKQGQNVKVLLENGLTLHEVSSFNINYYENKDRLILERDGKYFEFISEDKANNIWQLIFNDVFSRETILKTRHLILPVQEDIV